MRKEEKRKVLDTLNGLGGCDASNEYTKGWDDAINVAYDEVSKIKKRNNIKLYLYLVLALLCGVCLGFLFGKQYAIACSKITYEERNDTRWCYLSLDQKVYAYECTKNGDISK